MPPPDGPATLLLLRLQDAVTRELGNAAETAATALARRVVVAVPIPQPAGLLDVAPPRLVGGG